MRRSFCLILAMAACNSWTAARADTLIVDGLNTAAATAAQRPSRGMSMDKVESNWGQPLNKQFAIGDPPISRWEYSDFIVYFEYRHVIHAVVRN